MSARIPMLFVLGVALWPASGGAQPDATDPLVAADAGDPLELGRVAGRLGDGAILERLAARRPPDQQLAAVRAARFMRAPELALPRLAELAAGRDPDLAPAAALAAHRIARALDADALVAREHDPASLAPVADALDRLAADRTARADICRLAALAAAELRAP